MVQQNMDWMKPLHASRPSCMFPWRATTLRISSANAGSNSAAPKKMHKSYQDFLEFQEWKAVSCCWFHVFDDRKVS